MAEDAFEKKFNTLEVDLIRSQQLFCRDVLKLSPGQRAVISNGRVSGLSQHSSISIFSVTSEFLHWITFWCQKGKTPVKCCCYFLVQWRRLLHFGGFSLLCFQSASLVLSDQRDCFSKVTGGTNCTWRGCLCVSVCADWMWVRSWWLMSQQQWCWQPRMKRPASEMAVTINIILHFSAAVAGLYSQK